MQSTNFIFNRKLYTATLQLRYVTQVSFPLVRYINKLFMKGEQQIGLDCCTYSARVKTRLIVNTISGLIKYYRNVTSILYIQQTIVLLMTKRFQSKSQFGVFCLPT